MLIVQVGGGPGSTIAKNIFWLELKLVEIFLFFFQIRHLKIQFFCFLLFFNMNTMKRTKKLYFPLLNPKNNKNCNKSCILKTNTFSNLYLFIWTFNHILTWFELKNYAFSFVHSILKNFLVPCICALLYVLYF